MKHKHNEVYGQNKNVKPNIFSQFSNSLASLGNANQLNIIKIDIKKNSKDEYQKSWKLLNGY